MKADWSAEDLAVHLHTSPEVGLMIVVGLIAVEGESSDRVVERLSGRLWVDTQVVAGPEVASSDRTSRPAGPLDSAG